MGGGVGGLAAGYSKASKQVRLVEREVCFISDAGKGGGRVADLCPKAGLPTPEQAENFYNVLGGGHAETAQPSPTVTFRWVLGGLTSGTLVV